MLHSSSCYAADQWAHAAPCRHPYPLALPRLSFCCSPPSALGSPQTKSGCLPASIPNTSSGTAIHPSGLAHLNSACLATAWHVHFEIPCCSHRFLLMHQLRLMVMSWLCWCMHGSLQQIFILWINAMLSLSKRQSGTLHKCIHEHGKLLRSHEDVTPKTDLILPASSVASETCR